MYEKILAQLIAKHSGVSKVVLGLIAKKLAEKVTEENQIEGAVNDFEANSPVSIKDYADLLQSEGDKRVSEALKKEKAKTPKSSDPSPTDPPADPKKDDNDPKDVASIVAAEVAKALAPFQSIASNLQKQTKLESLKALLKQKGIPDDWAEDVVINDDFDQDATVTKLETRWNNTKQAIINKEIDEGRIIRGSQGGNDSNFEATVKKWNAQSVPTKENGYNIQEV